MDQNAIRHPPRHFSFTLCRRLEIERDIADSPADQPDITATCPDCGATMAYRGVGRLRSGTMVHYFECIHSHREVHTLSIVVSK
jgi:hypothetical protein